MVIAGVYSFKNGKAVIESGFPVELREVQQAIASVKSAEHKKVSKGKPDRVLYNPSSLKEAFRAELEPLDWRRCKAPCEYSSAYYVPGYVAPASSKGACREMDFVKSRVGVGVQFANFASVVYNVCAKMTIFKNLGFINSGVEIVPIKRFADQMSTGVSYFEQFVWDLEHRGVADIDIPVLILGIAA